MKKNKKIMVLPLSGKEFDMDNVSADLVMTEFKVPKDLFDMAAKFIPLSKSIFEISNFMIDVPTFDPEKKVLRIVLGYKVLGSPKYLIKFKVSFGDNPHEVAVSTDGGETWTKMSYTGSKPDDPGKGLPPGTVVE